MRFYNRENEVGRLKDIREKSLGGSKMTIVLGRRRIGKTRLVFETFGERNFLYFFVARKADNLLAREFAEEISRRLEIPIYGEIHSSKQIFEILFEYSKQTPLTVVVDEFQNYQYVNSSLFSDLQNLWDRNKDRGKCNLILMGSVPTLMSRIFMNQKEPLFGRADYQVSLPPFDLKTTAEVLRDHGVNSPEALVDYMIFTGGVPKYLEQVVDYGKENFFDFIDAFIHTDSLILNEGKLSLVEEFGKNYSVYFAILQLLASGKTRRSDLMGSLQDIKELGGYLKNLTESLGIVQKKQPVGTTASGKNTRYCLSDFFYSFWFRFINKYQSAIEAENLQYVRDRIRQDWSVYKGWKFEDLVRDYLKKLALFNIIGSYWDRKGENELDVVAVNEMEKIILIGECKLNGQRINLNQVREKSVSLLEKYPNFKPIYKSFYPGMIHQLLENPEDYLLK